MRAIVVILLVGALSCSKDTPDPLDENQHVLVNDLNRLIRPIAGSELTNPDSELAPLDPAANATVVGLGEATHGSKEFFQMKHRVFKYLVEKHGFRAFAFEMDMAEATIFDDYVQGTNPSDLKYLMKNWMIFWTWRTSEVLDLLQWMKDYNAGKSPADKVHFYGFDCQYPKYNADFLVLRINAIDQNLGTYIQSQLSDFKTLSALGDSTRHKTIAQQVGDVYNKISDHKNDLIARGMSSYDYEVAKGLARNIVQVADVIYHSKVPDGTNYRDKYMAESAMWISSTLQTGKKICLWAHDYHIQSVNESGGTMGYHIKTSIGTQYQKIGFAFSNGTFNAVSNGKLTSNSLTALPNKFSTNYLFKNASSKNFILNLGTIGSTNSFNTWANMPKPFLSIGALWYDAPDSFYGAVWLADAFDFIIYFDQVNHSVLL